MNPSTAKELTEMNIKIKTIVRAILEQQKNEQINPYLINDLEDILK